MTVALLGGVNATHADTHDGQEGEEAPGRRTQDAQSHEPTADAGHPTHGEGRAPTRSAMRPAKGAVTPSATGMTINSSPARAEPSPTVRSR